MEQRAFPWKAGREGGCLNCCRFATGFTWKQPRKKVVSKKTTMTFFRGQRTGKKGLTSTENNLNSITKQNKHAKQQNQNRKGCCSQLTASFDLCVYVHIYIFISLYVFCVWGAELGLKSINISYEFLRCSLNPSKSLWILSQTCPGSHCKDTIKIFSFRINFIVNVLYCKTLHFLITLPA